MDAKKKTILAALLFLWAGMAVWQWRLLQEPGRVPLTNVTGELSMMRQVEMGKTGLHVNVDLLASTRLQRQATFTVPRNIFAVPRPDGTLEVGNGPVSVKQPSSSAETLLQQENALELEQYRYLGFLRVGEGRRTNRDIAILKKSDEVLVLKVGDHIDDHLILKTINSESVTIRNNGTHTDQMVPLSEESSQEPTGQE